MSDKHDPQPDETDGDGYSPHRSDERQPALHHKGNDHTKHAEIFAMSTMPIDKLDEAVSDPDSLLRSTLTDDTRDLVFSILATARDAEANDQQPDFRMLTDDVSLTGESLPERESEGIPNRYDVLESLGVGANGQVFSIFDNNLEREVAAKFLHPRKAGDGISYERFIREARVTASLAHPNILPIYDVAISDGGLPYFTMRKAPGLSLDDVIHSSQHQGTPHPGIATYFDRADIIIKVCDAIAYAHRVGVIHQDIKPENIVLGSFGEVVVIDWGTAITTQEQIAGEYRIQGTPAFMAPEQARKEFADERSDIYAIGASLFQLLTLRLPLEICTPQQFWEQKRAGLIDPPTVAEQQEIPGPLLAIALKAMAAEPEQRYESVIALREDLRRYLAGLSIDAYQDSLGDVLRRIYQRNRTVIWVTSAALLMICVLVSVMIIEKQKEFSYWHTVYSEDFEELATTGLGQHWQARWFANWQPDNDERLAFDAENPWQVVDGSVVLKPPADKTYGAHNLVYAQPISGSIRVSWDVTAETRGLDLNCFIAGRNRFTGYTFHIAGYWDHRRVDCTRSTKPGSSVLLDRSILPTPIEVGRTYAMQMERIGDRVRLFIDGKPVIDLRDAVALQGPDNEYFGFESSSTVLRIDNVVVHQQLPPQKIGVIAVPDTLLADSQYALALKHYQRIVQQFPNDEMAVLARERSARCLAGLERWQDARVEILTLLNDHPEHDSRHLARGLLVQCCLQLDLDKEVEQVLAAIADDPQSPDNIARTALGQVIAKRATAVRNDDDRWQLALFWDEWRTRMRATIPLYQQVDHALQRLAAYGRAVDIMARFDDVDRIMAHILEAIGEYQQIIDRYPEQEEYVITALSRLDRFDEIVKRHPHTISWRTIPAFVNTGRGEELIDHPSLFQKDRVRLLIMLGRYDEAAKLAPHDVRILTHEKRFDEIDIDKMRYDRSEGVNHLIRHGLLEPLLAGTSSRDNPIVRFMQATRQLRAGEPGAATATIIELDSQEWPMLGSNPFGHILLPAARAFTTDDKAGLRERWQTMQTDPRFAIGGIQGYLAMLLDQAAPPANAPPLVRALWAELNDDPGSAKAAYEQVDAHDQPSRDFASWRIEALRSPAQ